MTETTFQRARSPEHKAIRREAILAAAAALAARDGVREVTLTGIADAAGVHKSALLRYFETREEIFLELTGRAWSEWQQNTVAALDRLGFGDAEAVAHTLAASFADRPLLCDLIPHTALHLERRVSVQRVHAYKLTSLGAVGAVGDAIGARLPALGSDGGRELVSALALLAGGSYQIATPRPPLAQLYRAQPELAHALVDLGPRLERTAQVMIAGITALAS